MKYAVFDMDGTILDSMPFWREVALEYAQSRGVTPTHEDWDIVFHGGTNAGGDYMNEKYHLGADPEQLHTLLWDMVSQHYVKEAKPLPYAAEKLAEMRACGIKCMLATATGRKDVLVALKKSGLYEFFDSEDDLVCRGELGMGKGTPEYFAKFLAKYGIDRKDCVLFEDALYSIRSAKEAGWKVVAIEQLASEYDKEKIVSLADRYLVSWKDLTDPEKLWTNG